MRVVEKRKVGRPAMTPEEKAGRSINFRVRGRYRDALEDAAKLTGRSLSEECEYRLTRSVQNEAAVAEMFGGEKHRQLLTAIGNAVRYADAASGGPDDVAELQVQAAIINLIERLACKPARVILDEASEGGLEWQTVAERVAALERGDLEPIKHLSEIMGR